VAHAHNAAKLERHCVNLMATNYAEVQKSTQWKDFTVKCKLYGRSCLLEKLKSDLKTEVETNFVSISILRHQQRVAKADWPRFDFG